MLDIGTPAPNFTATSHDGEVVERSTIAPSWLLLWWYPAAHEPGSRDEGAAFTFAATDFESNDCTIVGISFDSVEDNQLFRQENGFPLMLLSDPDRTIGDLYDVTRPQSSGYSKFAQRISYLIDPEGYIVQNYEVTDPSGHAAAVLTDLKAAQR